MSVLAVDPDPHGGSYVLLDVDGAVAAHERNATTLDLAARVASSGTVVVEGIQSYGMPVGESVFETVKNIGEIRAVARLVGVPYDDTLTRPKIKTALCGTPRAKDSNVRAALIDLYGGERSVAVGTKASPGPLYKIAADEWAALALGVVWLASRGAGPLLSRDRLALGAT